MSVIHMFVATLPVSSRHQHVAAAHVPALQFTERVLVCLVHQSLTLGVLCVFGTTVRRWHRQVSCCIFLCSQCNTAPDCGNGKQTQAMKQSSILVCKVRVQRRWIVELPHAPSGGSRSHECGVLHKYIQLHQRVGTCTCQLSNPHRPRRPSLRGQYS
jgi:hypothetical protein